MLCYNCGYHLPSDDLKECPLCGMKFSVLCHTCGSPNPLLANFCFDCGTELKKEQKSSVKNFEMLAENRKNVAVMFADVSGFTALSEKLDPEEVREIINDLFQYITKPVYELEGTIDKYIGDCVMILFGAKYSHRDDPKRAVICGMEMMKRIKEFSEERLSEKELVLDLSIGINYGLVVTGSVGNYFDKDYTVIGDIVNTAQRLQTSADKCSIFVSESVYLETKGEIIYSEAKELVVKNKEKAMKAYFPLHIKEETFDPVFLIEREKEIQALHRIHKDPETHYTMVIGEAGIGKTTLIKRFISELGSNVKQIWTSCNPSYQKRVYYVISDLLFKILNINPEDNNRVKENRLKSYIDYILQGSSFEEENIVRLYSFLSLVMGLNRDNEFQNILNAMNYEDIQREIKKHISLFLKYTIEKQPLLFVIDDLQWADETSLQILKELKEMDTGGKSLFIFNSRYEIEHFSNNPFNSNIIQLRKLTKSAIHILACKFMQSRDIDRSLFLTIEKYTDGNPLYIKELVTAIMRKESFSIIDGIAYINEAEIRFLPTTIERVILANLADLNEKEKRFLQMASVIGKDFHLSWVFYLMNEPAEESEVTALPLKLNLISLKTIHTFSGTVDKIYTFNQDTVREVLYDSLLNTVKKEVHKRIGEWIETKYGNDLENYYELLYIHFDKAAIPKKTMDYYYKAARKGRNDFNFSYAVEHYRRFLEISLSTHDDRVVKAMIDLGYIYTLLDQYDLALQYYDQAKEKAELVEDQHQIKMMIANVHKEKGDYSTALAILEEIESKIRPNNGLYGNLLQLKCSILSILGNQEALDLARKSEEILLRFRDYESLSETMSQAGIIYFLNGDVENALYYLKKAYEYAEKTNNLRAVYRVSGNLGIIYHATGMISKAQEFMQKSVQIAKKISNIQGHMTGNINLGVLYLEKGQLNQAERLFQESLKIAEEVSSVLYQCVTLNNLGDLQYERGNDESAFAYYNRSLDLADKHKMNTEKGLNLISITKIYLKKKEDGTILNLLEEGYGLIKETQSPFYMIDYFRYKSTYELSRNHLQQALKDCETSISMAEEAKNDMKKLKAFRLKGMILTELHLYEQSLDYYEQSIKLAEQLESEYEKAKGYYRKASALYRLNRKNEADTCLNKAKESIRYVDSCRWTDKIQNGHFSVDSAG